jgi:hypothetical protein
MKKGEKQQQHHHSNMAEQVQIIKRYFDVDLPSELLYDGTHFLELNYI